MKAKKKFGQNFLNDDTILDKIVSLFCPNKNDLVLEIGPGKGALTKKIKGTNLVCIEIDTDLKPYLKDYNVIYDDVLNINLKELLKNYKYKKLYIIGNLPYYITSPIMEHIIKSRINPDKMIFMVQKEVADRYSSKENSSNYGYMTIFLNHYFDVKKEFEVSKKYFNPMPKVDSAIISLNKKTYQDMPDEYFEFLKICFHLKRKTLRNNLKNYDWNIIKNVLDKHNIKESIRSEELSEEIFIEIFDNLKINV